MSTWAEKLKMEKVAPLPDDKQALSIFEKVISSEQENCTTDIFSEVVTAGKQTSLDRAGVLRKEKYEVPAMSYVNLGPLSLPVDLAGFVSEEFTFDEILPTQPVLVAKPNLPPVSQNLLNQGSSSQLINASNVSTSGGLSSRKRIGPQQRRQYQRWGYNHKNCAANPRHLIQKNPYYIYNGFGDIPFRYASKKQLPHYHYDNFGKITFPEPPSVQPIDVDGSSHVPFLDGSAASYRPSYIPNPTFYYSGQLQPWPPYYPPS